MFLPFRFVASQLLVKESSKSEPFPQIPLARVLAYVTPFRFYASRLTLYRAQLVLQRPLCRILDVLVHHRACRAHHPAIFRAFSYHSTYFLGLLTLPNFHKRLVVDVAHALFPEPFFQSVTRHYLAPRVDEEVHHTGLAGQHAAATLNIVDKPHVELFGCFSFSCHSINCLKSPVTSSLFVITLSLLWK